MTTEINPKGILITTGYGHRTKQPYVQLLEHESDWMIQLSPEDVVDIALELIKAAETSLTDQFIINFATEKIGMSIEEAVPLLLMMREHREKTEDKEAEST